MSLDTHAVVLHRNAWLITSSCPGGGILISTHLNGQLPLDPVPTLEDIPMARNIQWPLGSITRRAIVIHVGPTPHYHSRFSCDELVVIDGQGIGKDLQRVAER